MAVKVRKRTQGVGGWEVDIAVTLPDGTKIRKRLKSPCKSKTASKEWGEERADHLALGEAKPPDPTEPAAAIPTFTEFGPRYISGYARANREKPSSIEAKESILRNYLIPAFGDKPLDSLRQEDIQTLKSRMSGLSNKTVNNALSVLSTMLKCAVEWGVITEPPVRIRLLKVAQVRVQFYDFDDFDRLVTAARKHDERTELIVLLGAEAGLRRGEMMALEWTRIDFGRRMLTIDQAEWRGHVGLPKGGKIRMVPMTSRLTDALRAHRHLQSQRVLCRDDGSTATAKVIRTWLNGAQRLASLPDKGPHTLRHTFCSHLAMRGVPARAIQELAGHVNLSTTQRYMHLSPAALDLAIRALEQPAPGSGNESGSVLRSASGSGGLAEEEPGRNPKPSGFK